MVVFVFSRSCTDQSRQADSQIRSVSPLYRLVFQFEEGARLSLARELEYEPLIGRCGDEIVGVLAWKSGEIAADPLGIGQ